MSHVIGGLIICTVRWTANCWGAYHKLIKWHAILLLGCFLAYVNYLSSFSNKY